METAEYTNFTIIRQTKGRIPILPFALIKEAILGSEYELSLVFPNLTESIALHKQWKKKEGPVNTLSFPYDDMSGEIIITLSQARKEAPKYRRSYANHLIFLFIHSCLHLKGHVHGAKMEKQERFFYDQFTQH